MSSKLTKPLLTGALTLVLSGLLWTWFDFTTLVAGNELFLAYVACGAFCLGAVPVVLLTRKRLRLPVLIVAALYVVSTFGTWSIVTAGNTPVDPTPFGWLLLLWPAVLVVTGLVAAAEFTVRRRRRGTADTAHS